MAKFLSNRTAEQLKQLIARKPPTFSAGNGIKITQFGSHFMISQPAPVTDEFEYAGRPPISSADYGAGPGERLPMP